MSHQRPWPLIRLPHHVVLKVADGERPPRPSDAATIDRGLDDGLWELLLRCWDDPVLRPTMADVLASL